jgi:type II secretory pathway predicted ATPase ExeA
MNFHMDSLAPLSLILVGQPELRSKLRLKAFEAIVQRIQVRETQDALSAARQEIQSRKTRFRKQPAGLTQATLF